MKLAVVDIDGTLTQTTDITRRRPGNCNDRSWASLPGIARVKSVPSARRMSFLTSATQILYFPRWTMPACRDHPTRFLISKTLFSFGSRNHRHNAYARRRPRAGRATMTA